MSEHSRRKFLTGSAGFTAGALAGVRPLAAASAASSSRAAGANDRIRFGVIGCGGMGRSDLRDFLRAGNTQCVALCDVDERQFAKTQESVLDEFEQEPEFHTGDFRRLIERDDLDCVVIATPDHWHALPMVEACKAGKDVYVEKPLALTIGEGRKMVEAARKYDRVVQMGTQQRSAQHYTDAVEYVKSGALGKVRLVRAWAYLDWKGRLDPKPNTEPPAGVNYDMWLGPAPKRPFNENRFHFDFRWYWNYSGGLMTDWGAHMIDIANWGMGIKAPSSAMSVGGKFGYPDDAMETPDTQQVAWQFDDFSMIWEHSVGQGRGPEAREHGVAFHGNDGILVIDRDGWEVYPETDNPRGKPRVYRAQGIPRREARERNYHLTHVENFLECMHTRKKPRSDVEIGHNSMIGCHLGNIAQRLGRKVIWDVEKERFIDDPEAQKFVMAKYREPWDLKV